MAAAATIQESSLQGSLYELVARGQKDNYFVRDISSSYHPYSGRYEPVAPYITERRTTVPLNAAAFGNTFEVALEPYGDILTEVGFTIELPTWLPPSLPYMGSTAGPKRVNSYYWITGSGAAAGASYGYVNAVGYYLFERIQFYQDQILLQEWSGDGLLATGLTEGSWNSAFLDLAQAGQVGPLGQLASGRQLALRATPGRLRVRLPVPGCQTPGDPGFPLCCVPNQNYRFRVKLRKLEDIVCGLDASGTPIMKPEPWNVPQFTFTSEEGPVVFAPVPVSQPTILLETVQAYVPPEIKDELRRTPHNIAFRRQFENIFTFGPLDYKPFRDASGALIEGAVSAVTRRLDGRHPTERLVFFFRGQESVNTNRLDDFTNAGGSQFYQALKLIIAGQDREALHDYTIWQDMNAHAKDERDSGLNIGEMRWSLGDVYERVKPAWRQPEGTVNFTTADRPTLYIELADVPVAAMGGQRTEMRVFTEGWAAYIIEDGRGRLFSAN